MRSMRRRSATALSWDFFERGLKQGRSSAAEQAAAVDRAGMTVFRSMKVSRPARQLSFNVRRPRGNQAGAHVIYMIIEEFHDADPVPVYRRFRDGGRQLPDGLKYVGSWITRDLTRCYQVMECDDPILLDEWMSRWTDVTSFQVIPVITSPEAVAIVSPRL